MEPKTVRKQCQIVIIQNAALDLFQFPRNKQITDRNINFKVESYLVDQHHSQPTGRHEEVRSWQTSEQRAACPSMSNPDWENFTKRKPFHVNTFHL